MSTSNRAALIQKIYKVLKKHYKPARPPADRSVMEHLLYACCLENASFEAADEAFAKAQQSFFDWNEVRVTTVTELAETMSSLPDPVAAATRMKRCLQAIFEAHYAFDIEFLTKHNLGTAVEQLEKISGVTPFGAAYVSQHGLGGHSIAVSQGTLDALEVLGLISDADAKKHRIPGLERAITKSKGVEFASLLHQLGADFYASPWGHRVRAILVEIEPESKDRLPKRSQKPEPPPRKPAPQPVPAEAPRAATPAPKPAPAKEAAADAEATAAKKKKTPPPAAEEPAGKPAAESVEKKTATPAEKKSPTKQLSRKKPR
jgi:endonuclease-3